MFAGIGARTTQLFGIEVPGTGMGVLGRGDHGRALMPGHVHRDRCAERAHPLAHQLGIAQHDPSVATKELVQVGERPRGRVGKVFASANDQHICRMRGERLAKMVPVALRQDVHRHARHCKRLRAAMLAREALPRVGTEPSLKQTHTPKIARRAPPVGGPSVTTGSTRSPLHRRCDYLRAHACAMADRTMRMTHHQAHELVAREMHEVLVVARFEVQLVELEQRIVERRAHAERRTDDR